MPVIIFARSKPSAPKIDRIQSILSKDSTYRTQEKSRKERFHRANVPKDHVDRYHAWMHLSLGKYLLRNHLLPKEENRTHVIEYFRLPISSGLTSMIWASDLSRGYAPASPINTTQITRASLSIAFALRFLSRLLHSLLSQRQHLLIVLTRRSDSNLHRTLGEIISPTFTSDDDNESSMSMFSLFMTRA